MSGPLRYSILDPTGNITALVESRVAVPLQSSVASDVMKRHPEVEQVGFVHFTDDSSESVPVHLRMAGGEFCGNASMCAAALFHMRRREIYAPGQNTVCEGKSDLAYTPGQNTACEEKSGVLALQIEVSGASLPVSVSLKPLGAGCYHTGVRMPEALSIRNSKFCFEHISDTLPVVNMEGISHIIIEPSSPFSHLLLSPSSAEAAVREWCRILDADGLGLMFLSDKASSDQNSPKIRTEPLLRQEPGLLRQEPELLRQEPKLSRQEPELLRQEPEDRIKTGLHLTPLVFIPESDTMFWENSCASGSAAAGMYLASRRLSTLKISFHEPGGTLYVESDPVSGTTSLYGTVRFTGSFVQ